MVLRSFTLEGEYGRLLTKNRIETVSLIQLLMLIFFWTFLYFAIKATSKYSDFFSKTDQTAGFGYYNVLTLLVHIGISINILVKMLLWTKSKQDKRVLLILRYFILLHFPLSVFSLIPPVKHINKAQNDLYRVGQFGLPALAMLYYNQETAQNRMDKIQADLQCCGVRSFTDWLKIQPPLNQNIDKNLLPNKIEQQRVRTDKGKERKEVKKEGKKSYSLQERQRLGYAGKYPKKSLNQEKPRSLKVDGNKVKTRMAQIYRIPESCCNETYPRPCYFENVTRQAIPAFYRRGCRQRVVNEGKIFFQLATATCILISIIEIYLAVKESILVTSEIAAYGSHDGIGPGYYFPLLMRIEDTNFLEIIGNRRFFKD